MAFEITDLMIQVVTDGARGAGEDQPTRCVPQVTCKARPQPTRTKCNNNVTCVQETRTTCQENVTCRSQQASPTETELDALLAQLRATLAETAAV